MQCSLWTTFQVVVKIPKFAALNHSSPLSIHHSKKLLPTPYVCNHCTQVPIVVFGICVCPQALVISLLATFYRCSGAGTDKGWQWVIWLIHMMQCRLCDLSAFLACSHDRPSLSPSQKGWSATVWVAFKGFAVTSASSKIADCCPRSPCKSANCTKRVSQVKENDDCPLLGKNHLSPGSQRHCGRCSELEKSQPCNVNGVCMDGITKTFTYWLYPKAVIYSCWVRKSFCVAR